jgi:spore germination protein KC
MIGKLNGYETKMMMLARGDLKTAIFTIQDPKSPELIVPIELKLARKPKVNIRFEGNVPVITLKLKTNGDILAIQSRINYEDPELTPILEKAMKQHLKANLDKVIEKCKSMSCDAFYFGRTAVRQFLTIDEWEAYHWNKQFSNAKVITEIDFKVRSTEGMLKSAEIITSEGAE